MRNAKNNRMVLVGLFMLVSFNINSETPSNPYGLPEYWLEHLFPFTEIQLKLIKDKGIKKVIERREDKDHSERAGYIFNDLGQLISTRYWFRKTGKDEEMIGESTYTYYSSGLLKSKQHHLFNEIAYDSIAYDDLGRIIHYFSCVLQGSNLPKDEQTIDTLHLFNLINSSKERVELLDSSPIRGPTKYWLDNSNSIIKVRSGHRTDSVSVEMSVDSTCIKKYWYNYYNGKTHNTYRVGQEIHYKKNLIQEQKEYDMLGDGTKVSKKTSFIYDRDGRLLRSESGVYYGKSFYTYYDFGLLHEIISARKGTAIVITYTYQFN